MLKKKGNAEIIWKEKKSKTEWFQLCSDRMVNGRRMMKSHKQRDYNKKRKRTKERNK
jgi:hypothetical protein